MNAEVRGRVEHWKFESASALLKTLGETGPDADLIHSMGVLFGNAGWFNGALGLFVELVVDRLLGDGAQVPS